MRIAISGLLVALWAGCTSPEPGPVRTPNIVFILADDLGYGDLGCFGGTQVRTPHIDSLARTGQRWTQHYSVHAVCTPARAAFLTAAYPARVGLTGVLFPAARGGLDTATTTIAEVLRHAGYATGCVGKWHLGRRAEFLPTRHGFDRYFGIPYSNDMEPLVYLRDTTVVDSAVDLSANVDRYTAEAIDFIRANAANPFFLYLPHTMPHVPIETAERFVGSTGFGRYADCVAELDASTGSIVRELRRLGIDHNTLLVFTSDNGPWLGYGDGSQSGSAGPLRMGKFSAYEGGVRVPTVVRWPGTIEPGEVETPTSFLDWGPSFAALADTVWPGTTDGLDVSGLLRGEPVPVKRPIALYDHAGDSIAALRLGKWKLKRPVVDTTWYGLAPHGTLLFDLTEDPGEQVDRATAHPGIVARLEATIDSIEAAVGGAPKVHSGFW